jgi:putative transposase
MANYRRNFLAGGSYFFTVNLADRRLPLLNDRIDLLRAAFRQVQARHPFTIEAAVILPDHLHAIWTLPEQDADFALRWRLIKSAFSHGLMRDERISISRLPRVQDWPYSSFRRWVRLGAYPEDWAGGRSQYRGTRIWGTMMGFAALNHPTCWTKRKTRKSSSPATGKPAGVLIGLESEDDWLDYRLENDPRFLRRIDKARESLRAGGGVRIEDVE